MTDQSPPHSIDAEQELLGCLLSRNEAVDVVSAIIQPKDMFEPLHQEIYTVILQLANAGKIASVMTLGAFLPADMKIGDLNLKQYLARLAAAACIPNHAKQHAQMIRSFSDRRIMNETCQEVMTVQTADVPGLAAYAIERFDEVVSANALNHAKTVDIAQSAVRAIDAAANAYQKDGTISGLSYGLSDLDYRTSGANKGELIILAARPGMGKSALMCCAALRQARSRKHVSINSLEMGDVELTQRMISDLMYEDGPLPYNLIRNGRFQEKQFERIKDAAEHLATLKDYLRIDPEPALSVAQIAARARIRKRRGLLDVLWIDHIGRIKPSGNYRGQRTMEITEITGALKDLAKELDIPVIALSQLSREVEKRDNKRPQLSDLRDCLVASSLVLNADTGQRISIRRIAEQQQRFNVWALNDKLKLVKMPIEDAWLVGKQETFAVTTRSGRVIKCTGGHKFRTLSGWVELRDLSVGSEIAVPRIYNLTTSNEEMSCDRALLLGWLLGDGHLGGSATLTTSTVQEAQLAAEIAVREFGLRPSIKRERPTANAFRVIMTTGRMSGAKKNPLTRWLRGLGIWKVCGARKFVPEIIYTQPPHVVAAFLRGLFHADGSITCRQSKATVRFSSISEGLARPVLHLLLRCGINAILKVNEGRIGGFTTATKRNYVIYVGQSESVRRFLDVIGFVGAKHGRAVAAFGVRKPSTASAFDRIPTAMNERVSLLRAEMGISHAGLGWREQGKRMSRETATLVGDRLDDEFLRNIGSSDVLWDEIETIVTNGVEEVFDLTVGTEHNFCVDDFITHNSGSIEQDADVVMFMYREAYYLTNKEPKPGSAEFLTWTAEMEMCHDKLEVIVAKQRAGPTGVVNLKVDIGCNAIRSPVQDDHLPTRIGD